VYGVVPILFGEPGFEAVTERLDDLRDLGVGALWLAPITRCDPGDYGYAVTDHRRVNPEYGGEDDLRYLVDSAHERGIRVLLDVVPNHVSRLHRFARDARRRGRASPYYDYLDRDRRGRPTHYFDWEHLPNLNYDLPAVRSHIQGSLERWVREFDVDGFRVDAAWGVQRRRPDFWPASLRRLRALKPDLLLLAEASARDPAFLRSGFDLGYDWTQELGEWAWQDVWTADDVPAALDAALRATGPDGAPCDPGRVFRYLDSNDTGVRFAQRHGAGLARAAATLLLTLPGVPCLYTGTELGARFDPYETYEPLPRTEQVPGLRGHYRRLIRLRSAEPSLASGTWARVAASPSDAVWAHVRRAPGERAVLVVVNLGDVPRQALLPPGALEELGGPVTDLLASGAGADGGLGASPSGGPDGGSGAGFAVELGPGQAAILAGPAVRE
jgi:glycosidase